MAGGRVTYKELAKREIKPNRNIVISEKFVDDELAGYAIVEQAIVDKGTESEMNVFLKNGIGVVSLDGLKEISSAIDEALSKL